MAIMEALALGLPIVATEVGGMAEELTDGVDALLVPPRDSEALADAIERVATDEGFRTLLAAASTARAREFDVARTVETIEQTYDRVSRSRPESQHPSDTESPAAGRRPPENQHPSDTESPAAGPGGAERHRVAGGPANGPEATGDSRTAGGRAAGGRAAGGRAAGGRAAGGRAAGGGLDIRPATASDRDAILDVLRRSLGGDDDPRYPALFAWKHDENSFGPSPMWVATDGDRFAGFRTFLRWEFERGGQTLRAVRAVDTATDPDYQGRGLFTALTRHALDAVREQGVDFVFNTPNDQSRPGYLRMGWREVGRLPGRSGSPVPAAPSPPSARRSPPTGGRRS